MRERYEQAARAAKGPLLDEGCGSVRVKTLLPLWLPWARRHVHLTDALETQVRRISQAELLAFAGRCQPRLREQPTRMAFNRP